MTASRLFRLSLGVGTAAYPVGHRYASHSQSRPYGGHQTLRVAVIPPYDAQIDEWREEWRAALESTGDPLPCPKCFYEGQPTGRLQPMPAPPKRAKSKCAVCKTYFEYPDAD